MILQFVAVGVSIGTIAFLTFCILDVAFNGKKEQRKRFVRSVAAELWVREYDMTAEKCIKCAEQLADAIERKERGNVR